MTRLGLLPGRNREFHVRGERRSAHADDAGVLDLGDDLLRREGADLHQRLRAVDALGPVVALALDRDHHLAQALAVGNHIHGRDRSRNRGVNVRRHEAAGFGDELPRQRPCRPWRPWPRRGRRCAVRAGIVTTSGSGSTSIGLAQLSLFSDGWTPPIGNVFIDYLVRFY